MAAKCANCGRADLLQPDVSNYQCLACGALTSIATEQLVPSNIPNVLTAPSGHPVVELSKGIVEREAGEDRRDRGEEVSDIYESDESYVAPEPITFPFVEPAATEPTPAPVPEPVDFSTLTPEQIAAIEQIAHPGA